MKPRHWKLVAAAGLLLTLGLATTLVLRAFNSNLVFFYTPTQVSDGEAPQGRVFRVGGAQAVAAMAYGTESVPQVYKIFGPGNQYVTMAKQLVW